MSLAIGFAVTGIAMRIITIRFAVRRVAIWVVTMSYVVRPIVIQVVIIATWGVPKAVFVVLSGRVGPEVPLMWGESARKVRYGDNLSGFAPHVS